jgi:hypothetical protein
MKMNKTTAALSAFLLASAVSGSAIAAENAAGVAEHFALTVKTLQAAQVSAASMDKDGCLANIKKAKQHYKELTGDAAGKPMQDAMKRVKDAQAECEAGEYVKANAVLTEVATTVERIRTTGK